MVNYIIRVIRFGLPSRAVAPFILGVCRLIWLGHLVPTQLQKLSHAGAELCSSGNIYLAQAQSLERIYLKVLQDFGVKALEITSKSSKLD